jgi:hypothetical protein
MVVVTNKGHLRCWDVGRREARKFGSGRKFEEVGPKSIGTIVSAKINHKGTHVSLLTQVIVKGTGGRKASTAIHVYEIERDVVISYNFEPATVRIYFFRMEILLEILWSATTGLP